MKAFLKRIERIARWSLVGALLLIPPTVIAFQADNVMTDPGVAPIKLALAPEPGMNLDAAEKPNALLVPYRFSADVWPAFLVEYRTVKYVVAVSCGKDRDLPCSPFYVPDYSKTELTIRHVQSMDDTFTSPEGLRIGSLYEDATGDKDLATIVFSGNGECLQLESGWNACFYKDDLIKDPQSGQYRPAPNTRIHRFIK